MNRARDKRVGLHRVDDRLPRALPPHRPDREVLEGDAEEVGEREFQVFGIEPLAEERPPAANTIGALDRLPMTQPLPQCVADRKMFMTRPVCECGRRPRLCLRGVGLVVTSVPKMTLRKVRIRLRDLGRPCEMFRAQELRRKPRQRQ